jgi:hypothetical protein
MDKREKPESNDRSKTDSTTGPKKPAHPDPPRTTRGKWTVPKFGSAGSGGAELEPGPEKD